MADLKKSFRDKRVVLALGALVHIGTKTEREANNA